MMILNVLLVVIIATTIAILFASKTKVNLSKTVSPASAVSVANNPAKPAKAPLPINSQEEIDTLKKQLESENSKLRELRIQEKRVEMIRKETELEAKQVEQKALESRISAPDADNNLFDYPANKSTVTWAAEKYSVS